MRDDHEEGRRTLVGSRREKRRHGVGDGDIDTHRREGVLDAASSHANKTATTAAQRRSRDLGTAAAASTGSVEAPRAQFPSMVLA